MNRTTTIGSVVRKIVRGLLKVPLTLFVIGGMLAWIGACYVIKFFEWVYEADSTSKEVTREMIEEALSGMKKWFTRI